MNVTLNNLEFALIRDLLLLERYHITEDLNRRFGKVDAASEQAIEDKKIISAYDERQAKQEDPRRITAVILKNRNGAVYAEANFHYIPQFNTFYEVK